jgi:hypothetical protein
MARASYVWVLRGASGRPFAAFTVKHELLSAIQRSHPGDRRDWTVVRLSDGSISSVVDIGSAVSFMEANA